MEARYTYTAFSIYIAPCQVTGTLKKPVQSPKTRGMVLAAETSVARSALSPPGEPSEPAEVQSLASQLATAPAPCPSDCSPANRGLGQRRRGHGRAAAEHTNPWSGAA